MSPLPLPQGRSEGTAKPSDQPQLPCVPAGPVSRTRGENSHETRPLSPGGEDNGYPSNLLEGLC